MGFRSLARFVYVFVLWCYMPIHVYIRHIRQYPANKGFWSKHVWKPETGSRRIFFKRDGYNFGTLCFWIPGFLFPPSPELPNCQADPVWSSRAARGPQLRPSCLAFARNWLLQCLACCTVLLQVAYSVFYWYMKRAWNLRTIESLLFVTSRWSFYSLFNETDLSNAAITRGHATPNFHRAQWTP